MSLILLIVPRKEEAWFDMYFNEANDDNTDDVDRIKTSSNASVTKAKANDYDDVYFDEANEEIPLGPDNTHDGNSNSCNDDSDPDSNSGDEMPDDSDDDGYNGYGGYNEYGE